MALTSGLSHAASGLLGILLSAYVSAHSGLIKGVTETIGEGVHGIVTVPLDPLVVGFLITGTLLSFGWGIVYHLGRHGYQQTNSRNARDVIQP